MGNAEWALLGGVVGGLWLGLLWLGVTIWTYRDIRERTMDVTTQALSVFLVLVFFPGFNIPGLMLYLVLRPKESLDEAYARSLEEEALLREIGEDSACPSCRRYVEDDFLVCPYCQARLREACAGCGKPMRFSWVACPFCGTARRIQATPAYNAPSSQARAQARAEAQPQPVAQAPSTNAAAASGSVLDDLQSVDSMEEPNLRPETSTPRTSTRTSSRKDNP